MRNLIKRLIIHWKRKRGIKSWRLFLAGYGVDVTSTPDEELVQIVKEATILICKVIQQSNPTAKEVAEALHVLMSQPDSRGIGERGL